MGVSLTNLLSTIDPTAPVVKYSSELRRMSIPKDIYTNLRAKYIIYKGQAMAIPNGIYAKIGSEDRSNANSINVLLKPPIRANIIRGRTTAVGREVAPTLLNAKLYRNNYRFVVQDEPGYGEDKLDSAPYRLYQEHVRDMSPHAAAEEGLEIRMALLESFGWNLMAGSTVNVCPAQWNRNFFVVNCPIAQQPVFNPIYATYTNNIVRSIDIAAGGTGVGNSNFVQTNAQMINGNQLDNALRWGHRRRLIPLTIEGRSAYVLTISMLQAQRFSDPAFNDSMGSRWVQYNQLSSTVQKWHGIIGKWQSAVGADVYIVVDDRLPTLLPTGTAAPFGLAPGYMWPTDVDLRNLDNTLVRDACILHGAGAVVQWDAEAMHLIQDDYDYNFRNGKGYAGVRGIQQLQFDTSPVDPTGASRYYGGSAIIVCGRTE